MMARNTRPAMSRFVALALVCRIAHVTAQNTTTNNLQYVDQLIGTSDGGKLDAINIAAIS